MCHVLPPPPHPPPHPPSPPSTSPSPPPPPPNTNLLPPSLFPLSLDPCNTRIPHHPPTHPSTRTHSTRSSTHARTCAQQHFRAYDADGNGSIDADELRTVVNNLGENVTRVKLMALINEVDLDGNHTIELAEFLTLMLRIRSGSAKVSGMAKIVKKTASTYHVKGSGSNHHAQHAFSETEKRAFSEHINFCLGKDPQLQQLGHVPIDIDSMDLFTAVRDGSGELPASPGAFPTTRQRAGSFALLGFRVL